MHHISVLSLFMYFALCIKFHQKKGYICCHILKILVTGTVTKIYSNIVSLEKSLLPGLCSSTELVGAAIRAITQKIIGSSLTGWFHITYEELLKMLGRALKAGVPMEKLLTMFI